MPQVCKSVVSLLQCNRILTRIMNNYIPVTTQKARHD